MDSVGISSFLPFGLSASWHRIHGVLVPFWRELRVFEQAPSHLEVDGCRVQCGSGFYPFIDFAVEVCVYFFIQEEADHFFGVVCFGIPSTSSFLFSRRNVSRVVDSLMLFTVYGVRIVPA